ncbi:hypothetical protein ACOJQI_01745 [Bacillus salacetis]
MFKRIETERFEVILPEYYSKAGARVGRSKKVEDERERTPEWALPMRM